MKGGVAARGAPAYTRAPPTRGRLGSPRCNHGKRGCRGISNRGCRSPSPVQEIRSRRLIQLAGRPFKKTANSRSRQRDEELAPFSLSLSSFLFPSVALDPLRRFISRDRDALPPPSPATNLRNKFKCPRNSRAPARADSGSRVCPENAATEFRESRLTPERKILPLALSLSLSATDASVEQNRPFPRGF